MLMADIQKKELLKDNKNKIGIYRWNNLLNGKSYIGSSINLGKRLRDYFNISYLEMETKKNKSLIYQSLLKYGYSNFSIDILEYCDKKDIINREQYYFDLLKPEYNILKTARSCLGYKHSAEVLAKMSATRQGKNHPMFGKPKPEGAGKP
uniref:GIY-YIG domain-containing protein n=1 Tax=Dactylella tenuis TaxID=383872 RepID=A0A4Y5MV06_9PEZI|nr:hypothetical protein [Dactylella tenuis]QCW06817.1 hypothetical protein [Dactylella tenuis]